MKRLLFLCASIFALSACSSSRITPEKYNYDDGSGISHEMIVLGERLEDPYTVENMTKAVRSLYPTKGEVVALKATDYYVRLLPRGEEDLRLLENLGVQMLDHPLDYKIVREGDYYHDPEIDEDSITWQYAVVPTGFEAPEGMECELLDECYLADHAPVTKGLEDIDWDAVERESFRLTGNEEMLAPVTKGEEEMFYPKGRISIMDEDFDSEPIGVAGVKVSCNVFVRLARCYTDDEGYYEMERGFNSDPRYRIEFKSTKGFSLGINRVLLKGSISTLGKHSAKGYSICITANSDEKLFRRSAVNNAVYDYYENCYSNGARITPPPANLRIWITTLTERSAAPMLQQGAVFGMQFIEELLGDYAIIVPFFMPDIIVGLNGVEKYSTIYRVVSHELAHASHYMQVGDDYWNRYIEHIATSFFSSGGVIYGVGTETYAGYCEIGEIWAYYMENVMYRQRYPQWTKTYGTSYWFTPEVLLYLDDRGLNRFKIFVALSRDVASRDALKSRLLSLYPECKSMINEAFNRYL